MDDSAGARVLPGLAGIGAPWWKPNARAVLSGIHGGTTRAHVARAALEGASFRSVASRAGLAPNSVAPRLARTAALSPYADPAGRVGSTGVERARYDAEQGRPAPAAAPEPRLRFRRRTPGGAS